MGNLTKEQNLALKGLTAEERMNIIRGWYQSGQITKQQFDYLSLKQIKKEISKKYPVPQKPQREHKKTEEEKFMTVLRHRLNTRLNYYLVNRSTEAPLITTEELKDFKGYLNMYPLYREEIHSLIELGLRYPNDALNKLCTEFMKSIKNEKLPCSNLWCLLWAENHLVPNDTIRLMLDEDGNLDKYFSKFSLRTLIPSIKAHQEKESLRLSVALAKPTKSSEEETAKQKDIERKTQRLEMFNDLIAKIDSYLSC